MHTDLPWTDAFLLGFEPMDETHQEFVDIVNALLTCPDGAVLDNLKRFEQHAVAHFQQELDWMQSTEFPSTDCHDNEHMAVLKSVREVLPLVEAGNVEVARSLAQALADWFPGHADYLDSALALWMVKRRTGGAPVVIRRTITSANVPSSD
ncbi:MAG TPA: hemerythrin domain-containing protein [Macromonas sp.]|nr:hemerythrin domain-containing protein [Macromonas sp.]